MVLGIGRKELEEKLTSLYDRVVSHVEDKLLKPLSDKYDELKETVSGLEKRLDAAENRNTEDYNAVETLRGEVAQSSRGFEKCAERLNELEASQQKSGIVAGAVKPKGEVTFKDVEGLAREVSDAAYERIRDYFLLEMLRKGFEAEKPDFAICDEDSNITIEFLVTDPYGNPFCDALKGGYKTTASMKCMPKLYLKKDTDHVLLSKEAMSNQEYFLLKVKTGEGEWDRKLRDDLQALYQAYIVGYVFKCLDEKDYSTALILQEEHDLKEDSALLARMSEIMQKDPKLADRFGAHYSQSEYRRLLKP
jgi:hypothetical protein